MAEIKFYCFREQNSGGETCPNCLQSSHYLEAAQTVGEPVPVAYLRHHPKATTRRSTVGGRRTATCSANFGRAKLGSEILAVLVRWRRVSEKPGRSKFLHKRVNVMRVSVVCFCFYICILQRLKVFVFTSHLSGLQ